MPSLAGQPMGHKCLVRTGLAENPAGLATFCPRLLILQLDWRF